jgi:hypothetical protein
VHCRDHAVQLHRDAARFEAAGARLVMIGMGTPAQAEDFRSSYELDLPLLVDPDRRAYAAAGTKVATVGELLGPKVVARGISHGLRSRVIQGKIKQNPAQLGGVLIVEPDGSIPYAHLAEDASDHPPNDEVLAALNRSL